LDPNLPVGTPRVVSTPSRNPKLDGVIDSPTLKAGQVYQVVLYAFASIDPNVDDPDSGNPERKPNASVTVVALLKGPGEKDLITRKEPGFGGTWFQMTVDTKVPTLLILQVGDVPAFTDAQGIVRFLAPLETAFDLSNKHHQRAVEPLLPGNDLFYLMRVIDGNGNWQLVTDKFRTKQRKVTIDFEVMHIINAGVDGDETTAEFRIWVMEADTAVKDYFFGDVDNFTISDDPDPSNNNQRDIQLAPLCPTFVIGPKDITDATSEMGILTRGLIFRTFGKNQHARNFDSIGDTFPGKANVPAKARFPFPTGFGENVQKVPLVVRIVKEDPDVDLDYEVTSRFTVEYM
jgi:hypothetical protein